jgi:predicted alpha/beta-hydrolase family hydrolase
MLFDGPEDAGSVLVLAHGAGAPMDSAFMQAFARGLGERGVRVARFEFPYMAARRNGGRRPPDRPAVLIATWEEAAAAFAGRRVLVGGKSMGGRMATMLAAMPEWAPRLAGVVCLGYPFRPPGRPDRPRVAHLAVLAVPTLIVQGTRDPFGGREEVAGYALSPAIEIEWIEEGDHDLAPPRRSGLSRTVAWARAMERVAAFVVAH